VHDRERGHIDDHAGFDLRLSLRAVTLPARRNIDLVAPGEADIGVLVSRSEYPKARPNDSPFGSATPRVAPGKLPALCHSSSFA
jgi:hypothetical protein